MDSLRKMHKLLVDSQVGTIRRGLMDQIDINHRFVAIKGSRGVGKTCFLLEMCREYFYNDPSCLYVNINNLFIVSQGLYAFVERFYKLGGKVLMLDQIQKYPDWDVELAKCYYEFPELRIFFTASSILRVKSNPHIKDFVKMYILNGLSFREFLEIETGYKFPKYTFEELVNNHERIASGILSEIRPLAYFGNYLLYGYYPMYRQERTHIDFLLKNINLTLEFDIPYIAQIDLKYLVKLKQLLYGVAVDVNSNVNISKLSQETGIARATVQNYLCCMKNARLVSLIYDDSEKEDSKLKPKKLYMNNPNLLNAVCLDKVDKMNECRSFLISQLCPEMNITFSPVADFKVQTNNGSSYDVNVCKEGMSSMCGKDSVVFEDMIERGKGNVIPLWMAGFIY